MSNRRCLISATLVVAFFVAVTHAGAQALPFPIAAAADVAPPQFTPPANGRLTADQVRMFIAVRRATGAATARPAGNPEAQITALAQIFEEETRAAAAAGASLDEYRWVSTQVMDAMPEAATGSDAVLSAIAAAIKNAPGLLADAGAVQAAAVKAPEPSASARAYNRQLLGRFQTELRAVLPASHQ
jgi:hypothetical protein